MRVFITGATGFLGGNLARYFALQGYEVRVLARDLGREIPAIQGLPVAVFKGDLLEPESLITPVQGVDWVIHCGAMVYIGKKNKEQLFAINVDGTRNLCQALVDVGVQNMIHVSTVDTLGMKSLLEPADEETKMTNETPTSSYGQSKLAAESVIDCFVEKGLHIPVVLPCFMLGAWDVKPSSGQMILEIAKGLARFPPSGGNNFIHVRDVCVGIENAMKKGISGRRYILGHQNMTYLKAWTMIAEITASPKPWFPAPDWIIKLASIGIDASYRISKREGAINSVAANLGLAPHYFDSSRAIEELALPQTPIEEAIREAWAWFQENGYIK